MKSFLSRCVFLLLCFAVISTFAKAQDVLYLTNGSNLMVQVISADDVLVEYRLHTEVDGSTYSIPVYELRRILYDDGTLVDYGNPLEPVTARNAVDYSQAAAFGGTPKIKNPNYLQGRKDAQIYYRKYSAAGTGVLLTSLASPLIGLIPAFATAGAAPKEHNLNIPNYDLWNDFDYRTGYMARAGEKKNSAVWNNWLIGLGVNLVAVLVIWRAE